MTLSSISWLYKLLLSRPPGPIPITKISGGRRAKIGAAVHKDIALWPDIGADEQGGSVAVGELMGMIQHIPGQI